MYKILFSRKLTPADHLRIFKSLFVFTNITSLLLYAFIRLLFYNSPIPVSEDVIMFLKTLLIGSLSAGCLYLLFVAVEMADYISSQKKPRLSVVLRYTGIIVFTMLIFYFSSCKTGVTGNKHTTVNSGYDNELKRL